MLKYSTIIYNLFVFLLFVVFPWFFVGSIIITLVCLLIGIQLFYVKKFHSSDVKTFKEQNTGKIGCYLINLDRAEERLDAIWPKVSELDFTVERVSAVDGKKINKISSIANFDTYKKYFKMTPEVGTIGCALSHEKTWRAFLDSDNEFALIFEDDVEFDVCELQNVVKSVVEKKELWDIVGLELNHDGTPVVLSKLFNGKSLVTYITNVKHSGCYIINRIAAFKLLCKFYPIQMPLDHYFTAAWEFGIKFAGVEPRLVVQKNVPSQIKTSDVKKIDSFSVLYSNARYNIQRATIHAFYNILYFLSAKKF